MKKVVIGIVASSIVMLGGNVYADAELEDQYAFTIFRSCTTVSPFFTVAALAGVLRGVFTYDGEAGGSATFNFVNIPAGNVSGGETRCDLANVVVNADGSFTQDLTNCEGEVTFTNPCPDSCPELPCPNTCQDPPSTIPFMISASTQTGQVSVDGKTIIVSVDDPVTETLVSGENGNERQRLCILSGTGVSLRDADADDNADRDKHWNWNRDKHKEKHKDQHRHRHKDDD